MNRAEDYIPIEIYVIQTVYHCFPLPFNQFTTTHREKFKYAPFKINSTFKSIQRMEVPPSRNHDQCHESDHSFSDADEEYRSDGEEKLDNPPQRRVLDYPEEHKGGQRLSTNDRVREQPAAPVQAIEAVRQPEPVHLDEPNQPHLLEQTPQQDFLSPMPDWGSLPQLNHNESFY